MAYSYPPNESPPTPVWHEFSCTVGFSDRGAAWIRPSGELDLATAPEFELTVREALWSARLVIVDLRQLTFIDSTGIHRIVGAVGEARRLGRRLVFVRGPAQVDRLFELTGLTGRLRVIDLKPGVAPAPEPPDQPPIEAALMTPTHGGTK